MDSPTSANNVPQKEKPVVVTADYSRKSFFKYSFVNPKFLGAMTVLLLMIGGVGTGVYLIQKPQQTISQASLSPVTVNFQPAEIEVEAGSEFNVDIFTLAGENKITGADLTIKFDPKVLTVKSIAPKDFLPDITIPPKIASGSASISLGTETSAGISGNGVVANVLFQVNDATAATSTTINFDSSSTQIKVLNRTSGGEADVFGTSKITIRQSTSPKVSDLPNPPVLDPNNSSPSAQISDFNNDGLINSIDLSLMYSAWGEPDSDTQLKADLNGDGTINGMDYAQLLPKLKH